MKKAFLLLTAGFACMSLTAQNTLRLNKGQKFQVETVMSNKTNLEMMGQSMENNIGSTSLQTVEVKDKTDKGYVVEVTIKKMNSSMEMMGQTMTFDSEKKEDAESPMGQGMSKLINAPKTFEVDFQGKAVATKKADEGEEGGSAMAQMLSDESLSGFFMVIPAGKKTGDTWTQTTTKEGTKGESTFTLKSMNDKEAVVSFTNTVSVDKKVTQQGMEMNIKTEMKGSGEMTVDLATGMVKKSNTALAGTGTNEMMGQANPMTLQTSITTTVKDN